MCPAIVSGIVTEGALMNCLPIFSLSLATVPDVLGKVNSVQSPLRFQSGEWDEQFLNWRTIVN